MFILKLTYENFKVQFLLSIERYKYYKIILVKVNYFFSFSETRDIRDRHPAKMFQRERLEFCRPKGGNVQIRFD